MAMSVQLQPAKRVAGEKVQVAAWRAAVVAAALLLWEGFARLGWIDPDLVSSPLRILTTALTLPSYPDIAYALLLTSWELGMALVLAVLLGIPMGMGIGLSERASAATLPILTTVFSIPQLVFFPIYTLFFGIGPASKVAFGLMHAILPLLMNTIIGARTVNPDLVQAARAMGAGSWQIARRVVLPHTVPAVITGLRLGVSHGLLGVLVAELMGSRAGIGYMMRMFGASLRIDEMFAVTFVIAAFAILMNEGLRWVEKRVSAWKGALE